MRIYTFLLSILFPLAIFAAGKQSGELIQPDFVENRTVKLKQTVTLSDIPVDSKEVKLWIPIPTDRNWQRVLDIKVDNAPGKWEIVPQKDGRGDFVYVEVKNPGKDQLECTISALVERTGVHFPLGEVPKTSSIQPALFQVNLNPNAPLMGVNKTVEDMALEACGLETDVAKQALLLIHKVADFADHYSKDSTKPHCGIGSAKDCLINGGGCCTDLHSLFIAMARSRGIAARMQYGYRLLDSREGEEHDPGYRCWVEYFVPGAGWVPTDIVAADNAAETNPFRWSSLGPYRLWLWQGRSFELNPPSASGPIDTMLVGWAEIDGKAVEPLPGDDGAPSQLTRKVSFRVLDHDRPSGAPSLPE